MRKTNTRPAGGGVHVRSTVTGSVSCTVNDRSATGASTAVTVTSASTASDSRPTPSTTHLAAGPVHIPSAAFGIGIDEAADVLVTGQDAVVRSAERRFLDRHAFDVHRPHAREDRPLADHASGVLPHRHPAHSGHDETRGMQPRLRGEGLRA